ncbi:MAG: ComEC/Rec2 family competence protein [Pseudomonadota bacterium]|nr:ComEC/Rec2 family competence protein [Pseudomonadota bacterium]
MALSDIAYTYDAHAFIKDASRYARAVDFLHSQILLQRENLILWLPILLGIGIGLYFSLRFEPLYSLSCAVFMVALSCWLLFWPFRQASVSKMLGWYALTAFLLIVTGFFAAHTRTVMLAAPILSDELSPVDVVGRIVSVEDLEGAKGQRLVLDHLEIEKLSAAETPARIRLSVRQDGVYKAGDKVQVLSGLNPPSPPVLPGAFDFQRYAYFSQLGAFGFTFEAPQILESSKVGGWLYIEEIRSNIAARIAVSSEQPAASFLTALMTGKRSGIAEQHWEAMRDSGLAHMLAISGLHVGMVSAIIFFVVRGCLALCPPLVLRHPIKKYAAIAALVAAFFYMLVVGSTVPTIRAMLMTGIVLFAIMIDRNPFSLRLVALSAFGILLLLPDALLGASFQMSFAAVTALIFFYEIIRKRWSGLYSQAGWFRRLLLYFIGISMTSVIAGFATGLFSVYHFQHFANYSLISNFLAVPIMTFIVMPFSVLGYVFMPMGLEALPLSVASQGINWIIAIAEDVANMQASTWTPAALPQPVFLLCVASGLLLVVLRSKLKWLCLAPLLMVPICIISIQDTDLMIFSSSSKTVAYAPYDRGYMYVTSRRSDRFAQDIWMRHFGIDEEDAKNIRALEDTVCDEFACRMELSDGLMVSIIRHGSVVASECEAVDIVLSMEPIKGKCSAPLSLDLFDVRDHGTHLIRGLHVTTVEDIRGNRPWTVTNHR